MMETLSAFSLLLPLAALPPGRLAIEIKSPQRSVLTGEPVKLVVIWKALSGPVHGVTIEHELFLRRSLVFDVKGPHGKGTYTESNKALVCDVWEPADLAPGEQHISTLVLTGGFYLKPFGQPIPEFVFEEPGRYSLRAVYVQYGRRVAESNALRFAVSEPTAAESEVFDTVRETPGLLDAHEAPGNKAKLQALLATHPDSRYLIWPRIQLLKQRYDGLRNGWDSETDLPLSALPASSRRSRYLELAKDAEGGDWGHFDENALSLALTAAWSGGDEVLAQRITKTLLERHPQSASVRALKRSGSRR